MAFTFKDLQDEVKRRGTVDQAGTSFDTPIKNVINTSLFRLSREAKWRPMRRKTTFDTVAKYTTGSGGGTFTEDSKSITMTGATFITDGIRVNRRISLQGDTTRFKIATITGETTLTLDQAYGGTTISGTGTYSILGQEEYNLPVQASHQMFLWHEEFGFPFPLGYLTEQEFISSGLDNTIEDVPTHYRMWGEDMIDVQLLEASVITISSSASGDTNVNVTVFGTVSGLPDFEIITTNASDGTTTVAGSKSFSSVERVVKESTTTGRITVTANSANTTVVVLPVGDTTAGILYRKIQLWPLPSTLFPVNVWYYKDPWRLVNDGDVHELGKNFDEAIILLASAKLKYEQNQTDDADKFAGLYLDEVRSLRKAYTDKIDFFPDLQPAKTARIAKRLHPYLAYHQIGANYGPSS